MDTRWKEIICDENEYQLILERTEFKDEIDVIELEFVKNTFDEEEFVVDKDKFINVIKKFIRSYVQNKNKLNNEEWLIHMLKEEFLNKSDEEIQKEAHKLIEGIKLGASKYKKVKEKREYGISPTQSLAKEIEKTSLGVSSKEVKENLREESKELEKNNISSMYKMADDIEIAPKIMGFNKMNRYFSNINETIAKGNSKMVDSLITKNGNINQNPQLDGFIFEQFHENTFNIDAAVKDVVDMRAEALVPKPGSTYGKNSIDLVVKIRNSNGTEKIIRKYQAKLSDNPEKLFKKGNYKFQRRLYGKGHEQIGNTNIKYKNIESKSVSKSEMKNIQKEVQNGNLNAAKQNFENDIDVKVLSKRVAKQALTSGMVGTGMGMAFSTGVKLMNNENVDSEEIILDGLKAGTRTGVSVGMAGAIKVGVEKEIITGRLAKFLKNDTAVGVIAFSTIELVNIASLVGSGELNIREGLSEVKAVLAGTYGGIKGSAAALGIGSGIIASVGTILAPVVACAVGTIGYFVGSTLASNISRGVNKLGSSIKTGVKNFVKAGYETVKSVAGAVWEGVKSVGSAAWEGIKSVASIFGF